MELLTVQEVADLLKVSSITVRRYIKSGLLTAVRVGRNVRVEREKVEKLVGEKASNDDDGGEYLPHLRQANLLHDAPVDTLERYHVDDLDIVVTEMDQTTATEKENAAWLERELATGMGVLTSRSSIWQHIGMFREPGQPDDVSENKSKYIAEAYMAKDA